MLIENKSLTDTQKNPVKDTILPPDSYGVEVRLPDGQGFHLGSYTKTNKLITALYMVTDIMDDGEPIRNRLRTLGAEIISDIHSTPSNACNKIYEVMSFLDIAFDVNIISEMNCSILRKEFMALNQSIKESKDSVEILNLNRQVNLSDFFKEGLPPPSQTLPQNKHHSIGQSIGHNKLRLGQFRTNIGVQKGSTLMKALSDKTSMLFNMHIDSIEPNNFDLLKKQRREEAINIIKLIGGNGTIKDIKDKIKTAPEQAGSLVSCSEKTLQRELMSMKNDGVLNKTGEKRWSRYFLLAA